MPRLLATEYVYSGAMDECYNGYSTTSATVQLQHHQQNRITTVTGTTLKDRTLSTKSCSNSPTLRNKQVQQKYSAKSQDQQQQIHTISSSDEEELVNKGKFTEEAIENVSSDQTEDFRGFDDYNTPNSSVTINDVSQKDLNNFSNFLKRYSNIDFNDYREDSEGDEPIELDDGDNDGDIVIGDKTFIYKSRDKDTIKKSQSYRYDSYTQSKRKKQENDIHFKAISPTHLKSSTNQIVEINSNSTTNSQKQKRYQINSKLQLNLSQQHNHKINNNQNKCSTESTSEFPVSSPSNPQQARGCKYQQRPPVLKNTLPADSFERQLAMITACNPQMTLAEKIQCWNCEDELSDVEDVNMFDEEFKRLEKKKKLEIKQKEKSGYIQKTDIKTYDFFRFRQMILSNMKEQKLQTYYVSGQGGCGVPGGKCVESSESESSKSVIHIDDRPSTSAVAQQQLQQRRSKPQANLEINEIKRRIIKEVPKRNQNSTTPPQTSSSDNERDCFQNSKNHLYRDKLNSRQICLIDKLCPSSSEEAISQDVPTYMLLKTDIEKKPLIRPQSSPLAKSDANRLLTKNARILTDEEIDSVFRLHRLNRERDKQEQPHLNGEDEQPTSIIQMRLDFANENKKNLSTEEKEELFKTPIIPQKYLANQSITEERICTKTSISSTKPNEKYRIESPQPVITKKNCASASDNVKKIAGVEKPEKASPSDNDLDGVYHQQHEFCNYLGLTGMSTATAMANAVAELAQCNLARRSMRVLRQQQQERRDKLAREELEALKSKQLKEIRKRGKGSCVVIPPVETEAVVMKHEAGSHSEASVTKHSVKELKGNINNNSVRKSSTKSEHYVTIVKKEPEIKILCHIAANNKEETKKFSKKCIKDITQPVREKLMRQAKQHKSYKTQETESDLEVEKNIKCFEIEEGRKTDRTERNGSAKKIHLLNMRCKTESPKRNLRSPGLSASKSNLRITRNRSQILNNPDEPLQNFEKFCKIELLADIPSVTKSIETESASPFIKLENSTKDELLSLDDISLAKTDVHLISSTPRILQRRLQIALEESRKSKPSIFIVQSLENRKDYKNRLDLKSEMSIENVKPVLLAHKQLKSPQKATTKLNRNNIKEFFKARKGKKIANSQHQLRKRKIIVIKTSKPKQKSCGSFTEFKRELRSLVKNKNIQQQYSTTEKETNKEKHTSGDQHASNNTKSYRTVHTETKDLEIFLNRYNNQRRTRLMAKASALLGRSRRMTLRRSGNSVIISELTKGSKLNLHCAKKENFIANTEHKQKLRAENSLRKSRKYKLSSLTSPVTDNILENTIISSLNVLDNENVVVSSTTNTYDERPPQEPLAPQSPISLKSINNNISSIETKEQFTQINTTIGIQYLNTLPLPTQAMCNPIKSDYGVVLYIYYELEVLIVIQERLVSFWKCSKLINILTLLPPTKLNCTYLDTMSTKQDASSTKQYPFEDSCNNQLGQAASFTLGETNHCGEWIQLGELRRLNFDFEISVPYANRICLHNSIPIYLEMRAQQLPKNHRDCNLLSMYINIYYYHDEDMAAKCNSIQLDTIQSDIRFVNYTTLINSRYFIMTWPQENLLGKTRSGLCKYSLTPQLDTLASIREFKSMRHVIRYLDCINDDKLIGFGDTQVTIWDHRSGDVLMDFDLEIPMGKNLGSIYFSSQDMEQNNMLILLQYRDFKNDTPPQIMTLGCTIAHTQPSYRILQEINVPMPAFKHIKSAINTGDHLIVTGQNDDELWISSTNPTLVTVIPSTHKCKRFYNRERSMLIEYTDKTLNVNSLTNHILQLAAGSIQN